MCLNLYHLVTYVHVREVFYLMLYSGIAVIHCILNIKISRLL